MSLWTRVRDALFGRPEVLNTRLTAEQARQIARDVVGDVTSQHLAQGDANLVDRIEAWASREDDGRVYWHVRRILGYDTRGAHTSVRIDDATGKIVELFRVPH